MQFGFHSNGLGHAYGRLAIPQRIEPPGELGRGDRLVLQHDKEEDGRLSPSEIDGTRLGRKITEDRFAKIDAHGDGGLEAGELNGARTDGRPGSGLMEQVVMARLADFFAGKVEADTGAARIATEVLERLDRDGSGALNSEEIAGTRLAEAIGDRFYRLDGDRTGTLNAKEIGEFVVDYLVGRSGEDEEGESPATESDVEDAARVGGVAPAPALGAVEPGGTVAGLEEVEGADVDIALGPAEDAAAAEEAAVSDSYIPEPVAYEQGIRNAFETALEILRNGGETRPTFDVVNALYGDVQNILKTA